MNGETVVLVELGKVLDVFDHRKHKLEARGDTSSELGSAGVANGVFHHVDGPLDARHWCF